MDKGKTIYTTEQMKKTEELAMLLAKNNTAKSEHEHIVMLGCAFISGLEAGLQLSMQKGVESGANN